MQRNLLQYIVISLKGMAMGAADAVPGVSGGTIAFISGIYDELITSINGVNLSLLKTLKNEGIKAAWKQANGNFLLALLTGILVSFVSFMKLAKYLLEHHPILIWSFFFGLVVASILFIAKEIKQWSITTGVAMVAGAFIAFYLTTLPSLASNDNPMMLFLAAALAICAMILPGISGAFILVLLGAYKTLSDTIHNFDVKNLIIIGGGAVIGLLSFSKLLKWLLTNYRNTTMAVLTGFIMGSLNKIWPWKQTISVLDKETGNVIAFSDLSDLGTFSVYQQQVGSVLEQYTISIENSILPQTFSSINAAANNQLTWAIILMITGFLAIFVLEKIGSARQSK